MNFIYPMEPMSSERIPTGPDWTANIKWDGVRILLYYDGTSVTLLNRRQHVRTLHYPELTVIHSYCAARSVILDGEVIALGQDGKPSFHEVMRRDGIRRLDRIHHAQKTVPLAYMIFDVVFLDGNWLTTAPLSQRLEILNNIVKPNEHVQLVAGYSDGQELFKSVQSLDMEGVVIKRLDSPYLVGQKRNVWVKVKNYKDLVAVVGGFTLNNGGVINSLLLGLFNAEKRLYYIGHAGTGKLTSREWRQLTEKLLPSVVNESWFSNVPSRHTDAYWTIPTTSVKVNFIEWPRGQSLRQPSIQAIVDVSPEDCTFEPR